MPGLLWINLTFVLSILCGISSGIVQGCCEGAVRKAQPGRFPPTPMDAAMEAYKLAKQEQQEERERQAEAERERERSVVGRVRALSARVLEGARGATTGVRPRGNSAEGHPELRGAAESPTTGLVAAHALSQQASCAMVSVKV